MSKIKLTPEELKAQAMEMSILGEEYETLFGNVTQILDDTNDRWSENLSHNFSGKITCAQNSFSRVVELLQFGVTAANNSAETFESIDVQLSKSLLGEGGEDVFTASNESGQSRNWFEQLGNSIAEQVNTLETGVAAVVTGVKDTVAMWQAEYNKKGLLYKTVKTVSGVVNTTISLTGAAVALGVTGATGGVTAPIAAVLVLNAANDLANYCQDIHNLWHGDIEMVGKVDTLETLFVGSYSTIGAELGCQELGELVGKSLHNVYEIIPLLNKISGLSGKVKQAPDLIKSLKGSLEEDVKDIEAGAKGLVDIIFNTDISNIQYDYKLWTYQYGFENINAVKGIYDTLESVGSTATKLTKTGIEFIVDVLKYCNIVED